MEEIRENSRRWAYQRGVSRNRKGGRKNIPDSSISAWEAGEPSGVVKIQISEYQKARERSWQVLLECGINVLPVDLHQVCQREGISLHSYREAGEALRELYTADGEVQDGVSFCYQGRDYILYDDEAMPERQRYTIAHEIGHCVLEHFMLYESGMPYDQNALEQQAERFAIQLLAPCCVLRGLHLHSWQEIAGICGISRTAAERRLARLQELEEQEQAGSRRFLLHPLEVMVYQSFAEFVQQRSVQPDKAAFEEKSLP